MNKPLIKTIYTGLLGLAILGLYACTPGSTAPESIKFYTGTGDWKQENPIFLCELDPVSLKITVLDSFPAEGGAGYLALSPDGKQLFATSGKSVPEDEGSNSVAAYRIDPLDHSLEFLNRQSSKGRGNCHVQSSPDGKYVFAANYSSGHATALPVREDGSLEAPSSVVKGEGSGPNTSRQEGPHAHMVMMDPAGKFLYVPDLGTDRVMNYVFNAESGKLSPNPAQNFLAMAPGSGPRHLAFHPDRNLVYVLGELDATLTACSFDPASGAFEIISVASIVKGGFDGNLQSAAVRVHPNGKFVYATNRDDESNLAVFSILENGGLEQIQILEGIPYWPRDFNITPDGKYLIIAGARVDELALYELDPESGMASPTTGKCSLPGPICIVFIP